MGIKLNAQNNPDNLFLTALKNMLHFICKRIFHLWLQPQWLYMLFPQYTKEKKYLKAMHDFVDGVSSIFLSFSNTIIFLTEFFLTSSLYNISRRGNRSMRMLARIFVALVTSRQVAAKLTAQERDNG